ncbi:hypothetical protein EBZ39_18640 [bacterium]|nr:hypothetical protein [bacterium]
MNKQKNINHEMELTDYNIEWSLTAKKVFVSSRGDNTFAFLMASKGIYDVYSSGCCYLNWQKKETENLYRTFVSLIREGFCIEDTYNQFLKIKKFKNSESVTILDVIACP